MATLKDIKKRVKSVGNIAKITNAMQMVAASKMKKAQDKTKNFYPYAQKIAQATRELSAGIDRKAHKLLQKGNPSGKKLFILISTDKGLCGALNSNLFRQIKKWNPDLSDCEFITVGKKGHGFIRRENAKLPADFSGNSPTKTIPALVEFIVAGFIGGKYKTIEIIFNRFVNSFEQRGEKWQILPIEKIENSDEIERNKTPQLQSDFLIEPSPKEVLSALLPEYIENQIQDAALSAEASEYSARMMAMKNATENAQNLSGDLQLVYNKLRQQQITMSIADMVTARLAVGE